MSPDELLSKIKQADAQGLDSLVMCVPRRKRTSDNIVVLGGICGLSRVMGRVIGGRKDDLIVQVRLESLVRYLNQLVALVEAETSQAPEVSA